MPGGGLTREIFCPASPENFEGLAGVEGPVGTVGPVEGFVGPEETENHGGPLNCEGLVDTEGFVGPVGFVGAEKPVDPLEDRR